MGSPNPPRPPARCRVWLPCLLLLVSALPLCAQAPALTLNQAKREFRDAFPNGSATERIAATDALAEHGDLGALRLVLDNIRGFTARIERIEAHQESIATKRREVQKELNRLRSLLRTKKIGPRKVERVEEELKALKTDSTLVPAERRVARRLSQAIGWILRRMNDPQQVRGSKLVIQGYDRCKNVHDRADLLRGMIWTERMELHEHAEAVVREAKEAELRIYALLAFEDRGGRRAIPPARAALKDPVFQVKATGIAVLHAVGGREAADALIGVVANENGRLLTDAIVALKNITGQDFHGSSHLWREWIEANGHTLNEPSEEKNAQPLVRRKKKGGHGAGPNTGFYGINPRAKHPVYVLDFSGSMEAQLRGRKKDENHGGCAVLGGKRKVDGAATQLIRSVEALPSDSTFNVVLFASRVQVWKRKMMPATESNKKALRKWILGRKTFGATNLFGGLEKAFDFGGRGSFDKGYKITVDTILLLSDGSPTAGRLQKPQEILDAIKERNQLQRVAIHCIGLGRSINVRFLESLARQNSGEFVHVF